MYGQAVHRVRITKSQSYTKFVIVFNKVRHYMYNMVDSLMLAETIPKPVVESLI